MCSQSPFLRSSGYDETTLTEHPTLYFEDGSVILQCSETLFCVHRGLLEKHSDVFCDIFTESEDERFRGKQFVQLEDDDEAEIELLLENIYDGFRVKFYTLDDTNFDVLASLLKACIKYCVDPPRDAILQRFRVQWPSSLDHHSKSRRNKFPPTPFPIVEIHDILVHPARVIALLRSCSCDSPDLLAPLFYALTTSDAKSLTESATILTSDDLTRLISGMNRLRCLQISANAALPFDTGAKRCDCGSRYHSLSDFRKILDLTTQLYVLKPIEGWAAMIKAYKERNKRHGQKCKTCYRILLEFMQSTRHDMWDSLIEIFNLESRDSRETSLEL
ncbi:hypothetical protein C8J57DRAFT_1146767 [Mycena rebaudengoi]|nr:hypothetical protein C8J57DRAFT_1146767 [Mycena rebaudengoi]